MIKKGFFIMGLFNGYLKEGKGVDKDAPKPIRPIYFFELFFRKITQMIKLNLLFFITTIPMWFILFMVGNFALSNMEGNQFVPMLQAITQIVVNPLSMIILLALCFLLGPSTSGATYILINFATEMPVFLTSDYFEHFKKNIKQSALLMIINVFACVSLFLTWIIPILPGYNQLESVQLFYVLRYPSLIVFIILIFVNFYANTIMVLFKMRFIDIIKNSILFALGKLPLNVLILVLSLLPAILLSSFFHPIILVICFALILYSFGGFMVVYGVYPTIEKYMLIPAKEKGIEVEENKKSSEVEM